MSNPRSDSQPFTSVIELFLPCTTIVKVSDLRSGVGSCRLLLFHSGLAQSGTPLDWRSRRCIHLLSTSHDRFEYLYFFTVRSFLGFIRAVLLGATTLRVGKEFRKLERQILSCVYDKTE